jgi:hypothetical protein
VNTDLIKIAGVDFAYSGHSAELAAQQTGEQLGILVEFTGRIGGGGGPTVNLIGTPYALLRAFTTGDGGWSTGDAVEDAQLVYDFFREATPVYGTLGAREATSE